MASNAVGEVDATLTQIEECISGGKSFLLQGGAGSGKTYLLVETLNKIFENNPRANVACITFTKVAVNEIRERCSYDGLSVSTIHNFIWDVIKDYKNDLKIALIELVEKAVKGEKGISYSGNKKLDATYFSDRTVTYEEWVDLENGVISHDEVLKLASYMFSKYEILGKIVSDKFDFIIVDEYQDTEEQIVEILLKYIPRKTVVGFFGDSIQSIYEKGVGGLGDYITEYDLKELVREGNRRCAVRVIGLINKIRNDGLRQIPANNNPEGSITFLYSTNSGRDIEEIREHEIFKGWDFNNGKTTKELYLTHNLISRHARYDTLFKIYDRDPIIAHIRLIRHVLKDNPSLETGIVGRTFGEVLDQNLRNPSNLYKDFVSQNPTLIEWARTLAFDKLRKMYVDKDQLVEGGSEKKENRGDKKDDLIKHLTKIQTCLYFYDSGRVSEFTNSTDFPIKSVTDKARLKVVMDNFRSKANLTIEDAIELANEEGIVKKDDKLARFSENSEYLYERIKQVAYEEFVNLYNTEQGHNPFSTQHSVKGSEYDNVFIVLDNGNWNQYNFKYLFENSGSSSVIERTRKMFYVCCSRAKSNLVVYFPDPTENTIAKANEWFGEENVKIV